MSGWFRRNRLWLGLGLVVLVALALQLLVVDDTAPRAGELDPDNPDREGARAVARVLADEGIEVDVVRSADALEETRADAGTTVLVTGSDQLGESTSQRLLAHAGDARVVVVEPSPGVLDALDLDLASYPVMVGERVDAACDDPRLGDLTIEVDSGVAYDPGTCFDGDQGGLYAERGRVAVLGAGELLSNGQVTRADNAAAALRLLGQGPRLVWYVPDARDLPADDTVSLRSLLPDWVLPGLGLLVLSTIALLLWRSRRLGPLVSEPLPVVVRAIETTQSRGRLYRKANDRAHAAAVLRDAARARLARQLGLPHGGAERLDVLVEEAGRRTARPTAEITALLSPHAPAPAGNQDLVRLAQELAELDREVSQRP